MYFYAIFAPIIICFLIFSCTSCVQNRECSWCPLKVECYLNSDSCVGQIYEHVFLCNICTYYYLLAMMLNVCYFALTDTYLLKKNKSTHYIKWKWGNKYIKCVYDNNRCKYCIKIHVHMSVTASMGWWLACSPRVRQFRGSKPGRVKAKTIKLVFVASQVSTQN
jgi:hypothetical protein